MTALNLMHVGDAVVIFQDRASYDYEDGVIDRLHKKAIVSHDGAWAMGVMGNGYIEALAERTFLFLTFDEAVENLAMQVRNTAHFVGEVLKVEEPSAAIAIAGWSEEREKLECWYAQSWDWDAAKLCEPVEASFLINPPPHRDGAKINLTAEDVRLNWATLGALEFGRRLMEMQRRPLPAHMIDMPEWRWKKTAVGGGCDATIVTKDKVETITLAEWEDQIGDGPDVRASRPLGPCEILRAARSNVVPMSRAARRRAAGRAA